MNISINKPDSLGVFAGTLCMLHCLATPFLIFAVAGTSSFGVDAPFWWLSINYIFLIISFFAVLRSVQTTSRNYIKPLFWISWCVLAFVLINEQFQWFQITEFYSYFAAISLVGIHLINRRYCRCEDDHCCVDNKTSLTQS